jgi:hypothetical protein
LGRVVQSWAAACRGELDTVPIALDNGPLNLATAISFCPTIQQEELPAFWANEILRHPAYILIPDSPFALQAPEVSCTFRFTTAGLSSLKARASKNLPAGSWISTHDALTALLWTRIALAMGHDAGVNIATNIRSRLDPPLSETFAGNAVYFVRAQPLGALEGGEEFDFKLSTAAHAARQAVLALTSSQLSSAATLITTGARMVEAHAAADGPLAVTSWAALPLTTLDWGDAFGGQKCERVLAPKALRPRLCIILPQLPGGMDIVLGLKREHMDRLLKDEVFQEYATWESSCFAQP